MFDDKSQCSIMYYSIMSKKLCALHMRADNSFAKVIDAGKFTTWRVEMHVK